MIPDFIKVARLLGLFLFLSSFGTSAHHSVALQFDMTADITIVGDIVEMEWRNPHSWLHVEVETEQGRLNCGVLSLVVVMRSIDAVGGEMTCQLGLV